MSRIVTVALSLMFLVAWGASAEAFGSAEFTSSAKTYFDNFRSADFTSPTRAYFDNFGSAEYTSQTRAYFDNLK